MRICDAVLALKRKMASASIGLRGHTEQAQGDLLVGASYAFDGVKGISRRCRGASVQYLMFYCCR